MPGANENYNEYIDHESMESEIKNAIEHAQARLNHLESDILGGQKIDLRNQDPINNLYKIEGGKIIFKLDQVKNYLNTVNQRMQGVKKSFGEISQENGFTGTILAIQIALKAMETNPKNPKKYNIGKINGEYNEKTKNAIKQFQTDCKLTWKDGKPGKETIGRIVKELDNLINNRKLEKAEQEKTKDDVKNIIEESVALNPYSGIYLKNNKESIVDYIIKGKLNSGENNELEIQIKNLANHMMNRKLKYLIDHSSEPLKNSIQHIKELEKEGRNGLEHSIRNLSSTTDKRESFKKGGDKISENMFQELLIMEGGQGYKAVVHGEFGEKFPTGPYGMRYKHIDKNGNLLENIAHFKNGERVTKEWALKNAKAYYDKRAQEWKKLLDKNGYEYNQAQLDSLVSASGGTNESFKRLKNYVLSNWKNKKNIFNFICNFATKDSNGEVQGGLVARRQLEANRFMGTQKPYTEYQREYAQNKKKNKKKTTKTYRT